MLEQSGKLLRKWLAVWSASNEQADRPHFRDLFRHAARHCLITPDMGERWLCYRDNRNGATNNVGERFAEYTLPLLPAIIRDACALADMIKRLNDD